MYNATMKTASPTPDLERRFQALSDEKRLRILELLGDGERCVCELTEALDVGQSLLSFHLKKLREAELVRDRRSGRWVYYSLNPPALRELRERLESLASTGTEREGNPGDAGATYGEGAMYRCC